MKRVMPIVFIVTTVLITLCLLQIYKVILTKESYKQGQIDALTGKVKYVLEAQNVWREKK